MNQRELCSILARHRGDAPAVTSPGTPAYDLYEIAPEQMTLYQMELGYATAVCLGYALRVPGEKIVAVEGDGSMLAGLATLSTVGRYRPPGLIVLVVNNGCYGAVQDARHPAFPSATQSGTDLAAAARSCGITRAVTVNTASEAEEAITRAFAGPGPWFIDARVERSAPAHAEPGDPRLRGTGPYKPDVHDNALEFAREMRRRGARRRAASASVNRPHPPERPPP